MKNISIANDIVPIGEFKIRVSKYLKSLNAPGKPMVITQNGKPAGVIIKPEDYDELIYQRSLFQSINRGIEDVEKRDVLTTSEIRAELAKRRDV